jgi:hypothetical protein
MAANGFHQSTTTDQTIFNRPGIFWVPENQAIECLL